jgi:acetyltransferase-like isoleucine patch superfamily enzyme
LRTTVYDQAAILREYGAKVGQRVMFPGPVTVVNANGDFSNLVIGNDCHIGAETLFDLADRITIEDFATLSMRTALITHIDVGTGPLAQRRPRKTGPVHIKRGAYLGAGATVLHGVTVGVEATAGAHTLVDRDIPDGGTVVSPRAMPLPQA